MTSAPLAPGLSRKVKKTLSIAIEADELTQALHSLSDLYPENTAQNRRRLKATVEHSLVAVNTEFLKGAQLFVNVRCMQLAPHPPDLASAPCAGIKHVPARKVWPTGKPADTF